MVRILKYIALTVLSVSTVYSIYIGSSFTFTGILGIVFFTSLLLKDKLGENNKFLNFAFLASSAGILLSFIIKKFIY